jgi:protease I
MDEKCNGCDLSVVALRLCLATERLTRGQMAGRTVTSTSGIKDDLTHAGATWVDRPVVTDRHIVSARRPPDLPAFGGAMIDDLDRNPA